LQYNSNINNVWNWARERRSTGSVSTACIVSRKQVSGALWYWRATQRTASPFCDLF
jgi:hypothetical protein